MTSALQQLIELGNLVPSSRSFDWDAVEQQIGATVPADYRALLEAGGGGHWLDYITLYVPDRANRNLAEAHLDFEELEDAFEAKAVARPDDLGPEDRLLPWATTASIGTLYWQVAPGAAPEEYSIRLADREGWIWERYELSTTEFLLGVVRGLIVGELLDEEGIDRDRIFQRFRSDLPPA